MFKNKKLKNIFFLAITITIFVVVYRIWFFSGGYLTAGDWPFYFQNFLKEFWGIPQIWEPFVNLGRVDIIPAFDLFKLLYSVLSIMGVDYNLSPKVLYLWPSVIFAPLFSYIFLSNLLKNKFAIFIGILVISFNTYYILLGLGNLPLMAAFGFMPLIFYFFKKTLETREFKWSFITTIALTISTTYEPRAAYITVWVLVFYFFYTVVFINRIRYRKFLIKTFFTAFLPMFLTILLNFYWIFSLARIGTLTNNGLFSRNLFGNEFMNINESITLFHPFWTGFKPTVFVVQPIPLYFWLIPLFAFFGFFLNRKNIYVSFFGFVCLLGILLTKQVGVPFPNLYLWLYLHFPGFNAFRESSKFYPLIALGYSVLIAFFIQWLWENWTKKKWQVYGKYLLTIIVATIFLWNTKPFITGEIGYLFIPRELPKDYSITEKFLLRQSEYFRTLWIPIRSRWGFYNNNHPAISMVDQIDSQWDDFIKKNRKSFITEGELTRDILSFSFSQNLISLSSVKYVFIPLRDQVNDDDFFVNYGKPRQYYIDELNKIKYLHKINIGTKDLVIYENYDYRPHIYVTAEQETIYKDLRPTIHDVRYEFVSPTQYKFTIKDAKEPFYFNFSESFHSDWKIRIGSFNWWDVLLSKNYFLSDENHLRNDAGLSSFYIEPEQVCKVYSCKINKVGGYDIEGTLYFAPQSYMYLGLIVSGSTLVLVIGYLVFVLGDSIYGKRKNK